MQLHTRLNNADHCTICLRVFVFVVVGLLASRWDWFCSWFVMFGLRSTVCLGSVCDVVVCWVVPCLWY